MSCLITDCSLQCLLSLPDTWASAFSHCDHRSAADCKVYHSCHCTIQIQHDANTCSCTPGPSEQQTIAIALFFSFTGWLLLVPVILLCTYSQETAFEGMMQVGAVGKERLVLDLSCRKRDGAYYVVTDRWQRFSELAVDEASLRV